MKYLTWFLQILLAVLFIFIGALKATTRRTTLVEMGMSWAADFSDTQVRLIGAAEVAGGIGLIVPAATGIAPLLTPAAAVGLALIMGGAVVTHLRRGEPPYPPLILGALSLLVAFLTYRRYAVKKSPERRLG